MATQSFKEIISGDKPVLVDFYADWCGPCKMMSPVVEQVSKEMAEQVRVLKVDVDRNQSAAMAYQIQGVPTFIIFKNGKAVWRQSGAMPAQTLRSALQQSILLN
jgi:thioredoxin 1